MEKKKKDSREKKILEHCGCVVKYAIEERLLTIHNGNDKAIKWWYHNRNCCCLGNVPANVFETFQILRRLDHFNFTLA